MQLLLAGGFCSDGDYFWSITRRFISCGGDKILFQLPLPPLTVFMVPPGSVDKWQSGTPPLSVSECLQFSLDYLYSRELTTFVLFWADPLV